jgi:alkyl sulfatase BDS1-like metallo-beta-lactamase superfamily hydrolase
MPLGNGLFGALIWGEGHQLRITINRADLEPIMMRKATFVSQAAAGRASLQGNPQVLQQLMACLSDFDQYFEIMPGTKAVVAAPSSP